MAAEPASGSGVCHNTEFGFINTSSPAEPDLQGDCGDDDDDDDVNQAASYDDINQGTASNCSNKSSYEVHHLQDPMINAYSNAVAGLKLYDAEISRTDLHGMQDDFNPCEEPDADGCGWEDTERVVDTAFLDVSMLCSPSTARPR